MLTFERAIFFSLTGLHLRKSTVVWVLTHHEIITILAELCLFIVELVRTLVTAELALRDNYSFALVDCTLVNSTILAKQILLLNLALDFITRLEACLVDTLAWLVRASMKLILFHDTLYSCLFFMLFFNFVNFCELISKCLNFLIKFKMWLHNGNKVLIFIAAAVGALKMIERYLSLILLSN